MNLSRGVVSLLLLGSLTPASLPASVSAASHSGPAQPDPTLLRQLEQAFPAPQQTLSLPRKDGTLLYLQLQAARAQLPAPLVQRAEALVAPAAGELSYDTDHFRFYYSLSGRSAVPAGDADGSGVPDYVEDMGAYAEYSWRVEVDELGFEPPPVEDRLGGRMAMQFRDMNNYGLTVCLRGACTITLENDFAGFPSNDDPEGYQVGAMKVTVAHELKHAVQYAMSHLTELGWVELDATWIEDVAYPLVNDYIHYG